MSPRALGNTHVVLGLGIAMMLLVSAAFFVAWLSIDEPRSQPQEQRDQSKGTPQPPAAAHTLRTAVQTEPAATRLADDSSVQTTSVTASRIETAGNPATTDLADAPSSELPTAQDSAPSSPPRQPSLRFLQDTYRLTQRELDQIGVTDRGAFAEDLAAWQPVPSFLGEDRRDVGVVWDLAFALESPLTVISGGGNRVARPLRDVWWAQPVITAVWEEPQSRSRDTPLWLTWGHIGDDAGESVTQTFGRLAVRLNDRYTMSAWQLALPEDTTALHGGGAVFATLSALGPAGVIDPPLCAGTCRLVGTDETNVALSAAPSRWPTWLSVPTVYVGDVRVLPEQFYQSDAVDADVTLRFLIGDPHIHERQVTVWLQLPGDTERENPRVSFDAEAMRDATPWEPAVISLPLPRFPQMGFDVRVWGSPSPELGAYRFFLRLPPETD